MMLRRGNAHAIVNGAFLLKVVDFRVVESPRLAFGGISADFNTATKTEKAFQGLDLRDEAGVKAALKQLYDECIPDDVPIASSPVYRRNLATALLYKVIINLTIIYYH